jgi:atypical dual specificity phosphatase
MSILQTLMTTTSLPAANESAEKDPVLELSEFGIAFGERIVLSAVNFRVPARGVTTLLGPGGTGKSTLLRTIAGFNNANPSMRTWGEARYRGQPLGDRGLPALVAQSARLLLSSIFQNVVHGLPNRNQLTPVEQREIVKAMLNDAGLAELIDCLDEPAMKLPLAKQRHLAIVRSAAANPALLCVDEPTTGIGEDESASLLAYLERESEQRAILAVLHNQAQARHLGGRAALLAGGVIQEANTIPHFFDSPQSRAAREFVNYGSCTAPAPDADPEGLDDCIEPLQPLPELARRPSPRASGPRGFLWLKRCLLAGTPRPGIVAELEHDLQALTRAGISALISLTERPMDPAPLLAHGIQHVASPIPDMCAPGLGQAVELCRRIDAFIAQGSAVAVHCRAGLGRTGTILACYLIWEGMEALDALEEARRIQPNWVQSTEQAEFLEDFAGYLAKHRAVVRRPAARAGTSPESGRHKPF